MTEQHTRREHDGSCPGVVLGVNEGEGQEQCRMGGGRGGDGRPPRKRLWRRGADVSTRQGVPTTSSSSSPLSSSSSSSPSSSPVLNRSESRESLVSHGSSVGTNTSLASFLGLGRNSSLRAFRPRPSISNAASSVYDAVKQFEHFISRSFSSRRLDSANSHDGEDDEDDDGMNDELRRLGEKEHELRQDLEGLHFLVTPHARSRQLKRASMSSRAPHAQTNTDADKKMKPPRTRKRKRKRRWRLGGRLNQDCHNDEDEDSNNYDDYVQQAQDEHEEPSDHELLTNQVNDRPHSHWDNCEHHHQHQQEQEPLPALVCASPTSSASSTLTVASTLTLPVATASRMLGELDDDKDDGDEDGTEEAQQDDISFLTTATSPNASPERAADGTANEKDQVEPLTLPLSPMVDILRHEHAMNANFGRNSFFGLQRQISSRTFRQLQDTLEQVFHQQEEVLLVQEDEHNLIESEEETSSLLPTPRRSNVTTAGHTNFLGENLDGPSRPKSRTDTPKTSHETRHVKMLPTEKEQTSPTKSDPRNKPHAPPQSSKNIQQQQQKEARSMTGFMNKVASFIFGRHEYHVLQPSYRLQLNRGDRRQVEEGGRQYIRTYEGGLCVFLAVSIAITSFFSARNETMNFNMEDNNGVTAISLKKWKTEQWKWWTLVVLATVLVPSIFTWIEVKLLPHRMDETLIALYIVLCHFLLRKLYYNYFFMLEEESSDELIEQRPH